MHLQTVLRIMGHLLLDMQFKHNIVDLSIGIHLYHCAVIVSIKCHRIRPIQYNSIIQIINNRIVCGRSE